jgi:hypothetical protein
MNYKVILLGEKSQTFHEVSVDHECAVGCRLVAPWAQPRADVLVGSEVDGEVEAAPVRARDTTRGNRDPAHREWIFERDLLCQNHVVVLE